MLPTDWFAPSRMVQRRIADRRATQFWDKDHLVAKDLRKHLSAWHNDCCSRSGILWDVVAVYGSNAHWDSSPEFIDGPVVRAAPEVAKQLSAQVYFTVNPKPF